jgi:hypothetical protein
MQTITVDILNSKALKLLQDLELLKLIRLRKENSKTTPISEWSKKFKGAMGKQPLSGLDQQLKQLRDDWE